MPEQLDLTTPIVAPSRTTYSIKKLLLDWPNQIIEVTVVGSDGIEVRNEYIGATAVALMTILNTSNLSTVSLQKRILQKLVVDGKLPAGNVSGVPS